MKRIISLLLALMLLCGAALADTDLNVTGSGTIYMEADVATAILGVSMNGEDLAQLQQQVNETMNAICAALVEAGLDEAAISTNYLYISLRYDYSGETEAIIGYSINNSISIRTGDIDRIGAYIDAAFAAGANNFDSISFTVEDDSEARLQALELAVQDARQKAEIMAAACGMKITGMESVSEGISQDYWSSNASGSVRYAMAEDKALGAGTTVRAAQVEVTAQVQISFEME